jgi:hypothetical protein
VLAVALGMGLLVLQSQPIRSEREVEAVVRTAAAGNDPYQRYFHIECEIEDGRIVLVTMLAPMPPSPGSRVVLRERVTWPGPTSYQWEGITK